MSGAAYHWLGDPRVPPNNRLHATAHRRFAAREPERWADQ
jgi:hypothetical protein